jgi:very-short-patch-repair endonuclease
MSRQIIQPLRRAFARKMRADATKAENLLWQALRNRQLEGLKFKRQVPLDGYILDFVCFEARLIIEVDGGQHSESERDVVRDRHFGGKGFRTIRFWNDDVDRSLDGVCLTILREVKGRSGKVIPSLAISNT